MIQVKTVKVMGRVVIITGPVSTGKSSLSYKMMKSYNKGSSVVIPFGRANPNNIAMLEAVLKAQKEIQESVLGGIFTIINTHGVTYENLLALVVALRVMGYKDTITIVKLNLPEKLHLDYWNRNRNRDEISLKKLKRERVMFEKILGDSTMGDSNVVSIEVNDPEHVAYKFE